MTAHRHFGDTAEFAAAVEQLADPLNDPLPDAAEPVAQPSTAPLTTAPVAPQGEVPGRPAYEEGFQGAVRSGYGQPPTGPWPARPAPEAVPAPAPPAPVPMPVPAPGEPPEPGPWRGGAAEQPYAAAAGAVRRHLSEEERAAVRRRVAGAPGDTVAMPAVTVPEPGRDQDRDRDPDRGAPPSTPDALTPGGGGRAARRKAAQEAARRGGRGRRRSGAQVPSADATEAATAPLASTPASPAAPRSRVEARRAARAAKESPAVIASRVAGELFITMGVLMLLFVTYQLWWTNVLAHQQAGGAASTLQKQWDVEKDPNRDPGAFTPGQGFAIMYIPKLDVKAPIAEGVDKHKVLDKGMIGHYSGALETAMPWDKKGNFALAAHRNTHGEPFRYVNKLVAGDKVVVETESTFYTYEITSMLPSTPPSNISVIKPVPVGSGFTKPGRYITLTTCTPEFTSKYRLIVWGKMVEERPRSKGKPDALVE